MNAPEIDDGLEEIKCHMTLSYSGNLIKQFCALAFCRFLFKAKRHTNDEARMAEIVDDSLLDDGGQVATGNNINNLLCRLQETLLDDKRAEVEGVEGCVRPGVGRLILRSGGLHGMR